MRWNRSISVLTVATAVVAAVLVAAPADAAVSADEAKKLDGELTPTGAVRAGNDDGTIPAWDGGITEPPAGYREGMHHPDPFAADEPLMTISAANAQQYADKLSPGQLAMFARYPASWRMKVYPTRRSASWPEDVYEALKANAVSAELTPDGNGVLGARLTSPFPIPQSGLECIWNHLLRYRGRSVRRVVGQTAPTASGNYTMVTIEEQVLWAYAQPDVTIEDIDNKLAYFLQTVSAPARLAGNILLVHETLNQAAEPRKAWVYNPGQRRVRRAPNVAYDNPGTASDGLRTNDQLDLFNGAPDRYDWELIGRREMYVPYNAYAVHSDQLSNDDILMAGHLNSDNLRYELHRVWVVEATVKDGTSHIYARRTFYFDEDTWQALAVDQYDKRGEIWRVSEAHTINYYDQPFCWDTLQVHYDLQNGRYLVYGLNNEGKIDEFDVKLSRQNFTPEAVRRSGRR